MACTLTPAKRNELVRMMAIKMLEQFHQDDLNFFWNSLENIRGALGVDLRQQQRKLRKTEADEKLGDYESEAKRLRGLINTFRFSMEDQVEESSQKMDQKHEKELRNSRDARKSNLVKISLVSRQVFETNKKMNKNLLKFSGKMVRLSEITGEGRTIELPPFKRQLASLKKRSSQQQNYYDSDGNRVPSDLMSHLKATERFDRMGITTRKIRTFGSKIV